MVFAHAWPPAPAERFLPVDARRAALASRLNGLRFGAPLLPDTAGFSPDQRLHTPAEFGRVFAEPARSSDRFFTVLARSSGRSAARLGLTVSRRVAKTRRGSQQDSNVSRANHFATSARCRPGISSCSRASAPIRAERARAARESRSTLRATDEGGRRGGAAWITSAYSCGSRCSAWRGSPIRRGRPTTAPRRERVPSTTAPPVAENGGRDGRPCRA